MSAQRKRTSASEARARLKAARDSQAPAEAEPAGEDAAQEARLAAVQHAAGPGQQPVGADPARVATGPAGEESAPFPQAFAVPPEPEQAVAVREPERLAPAPSSNSARLSDHQRGTGIDIPPELHERIQREARSRSRNGQPVTQTEILLQAFETVYERLPELVTRHRARNQTSSPLFGARAVQVAERQGAMKRLQVRPTYDQHHRMHALAEHFDLNLSVLTRIVLHAYFHPQEDSAR